MDFYQAHLTMVECGAPIDVSKRRKGRMDVWLWVSRIARAYYGASDWGDREKARIYLQTRLGRLLLKETFLTELSPIPSGKLSPEESLRPSELRDRRWATLRQHLNEGPPKLVICYGKSRKDWFQEFLQVCRWVPLSPAVAKAQDSAYYLMPFFGQGQMSAPVLTPLIEHSAFTRASPILPPVGAQSP